MAPFGQKLHGTYLFLHFTFSLLDGWIDECFEESGEIIPYYRENLSTNNEHVMCFEVRI